MRCAMVLMLTLLAVAPGCSTETKEEPEPLVSVPLEFDPTEPYALSVWWTNGDELLYLGADGSYALYEGANRYRAPAERGRWWRQSYAALWLEPYARLRRETTRAAIRKIGNELALDIALLERMTALDRPPEVLEDRLIGDWRGAAGRLRLDADLRYVYSPRPERSPTPARLAGHEGAWRVSGNAVWLQPDSPTAKPLVMTVGESNETLVLESAEGAFQRTPAETE
ncbi:MAG: hypothetical protein ACYS0G_13485 [Planctomycetota bacterium]|jgi:hypothetical protein